MIHDLRARKNYKRSLLENKISWIIQVFTPRKQGMQFHYLVFTEQDLLGRRLAVRDCGPKKPNNMVEKWEFRRVSRSHRNWHSASSCQLNDSFLYISIHFIRISSLKTANFKNIYIRINPRLRFSMGYNFVCWKSTNKIICMFLTWLIWLFLSLNGKKLANRLTKKLHHWSTGVK